MGGQEENSGCRQGRPGRRLSTSTWGMCTCSEWATFQEPTRKGESGQLNNSQWSCNFLIFFFFFFGCGPFSKSLLNWLQCCFCFMFWFSGHEACGILAPQPGIKPILPVWKGKISCTGPLGKSLGVLALSTLCLLCPCFIPVTEISLLHCLSIGWTTDLSEHTVSFPDARASNRNHALNKVKC